MVDFYGLMNCANDFRIVGMRPFALNMESINKAGDSNFLQSMVFCIIYTLFATNSCSWPHILYLYSLWGFGFLFFFSKFDL